VIPLAPPPILYKLKCQLSQEKVVENCSITNREIFGATGKKSGETVSV
jgi:hypothetical protein